MKKRCFKILALWLAVCLFAAGVPVPAAARADAAGAPAQVRVIVENNTWPQAEGAAWEGNLLDVWVEVDADSTALTALQEAIEENGHTQTGVSAGYISSVDGLCEDYADGSQKGWMASLNDWFPDEGLSSYGVSNGKLKSGDEIRLQFSCSFGADIGSDWTNTSTALKALTFREGELSPAFDGSVLAYTLTLPAGAEETAVMPTAENKNFQVRIYKNAYDPAGNTDYRRGAAIPAAEGDTLYIGVGNQNWPGSAYVSETVYTVRIVNAEIPVPESLTVSFTGRKDGAFLGLPGQLRTVTEGLAGQYGYEAPEKDSDGAVIKGPTLLDLLTEIHKETYGDAFTKNTAKEYLDLDAAGNLTKAFGEAAGYAGFLVNGVFLNAGEIPGAVSLKEGDMAEFCFSREGDGRSLYTFFTEAEKTVTAGEAFALSLKGFPVTADAELQPIAGDGITLHLVNEDGSLSGALTDASGSPYRLAQDGTVSLVLSEPGEYILTAAGSEESGDSILLPVCRVTAEEAPDNGAWEEILRAVGDSLLSGPVPGVGDIGGEWTIIGLAREGRISDAFREGYYARAAEALKAAGSDRLHRSKSTENSRMVLALTALGYDPTDVDGKNLLAPLADLNYVKKQGINGVIWALIAFDSAGYEIPAAADGQSQATREGLIGEILQSQREDGGWGLDLAASGVDVTAMAVQALAPYEGASDDVASALDRALAYLSGQQSADGNFVSYGSGGTESCAQVILTLTSLGLDPGRDERFIKEGDSAWDALLSCYSEGGFRHTPGGSVSRMATEQGYCALVSWRRLAEGKTRLYDMSDVERIENPSAVPEEEPGSQEVTAPPTADPAGTFAWLFLFLGAGCAAAVFGNKYGNRKGTNE
jgi:hypothetical protein